MTKEATPPAEGPEEIFAGEGEPGRSGLPAAGEEVMRVPSRALVPEPEQLVHFVEKRRTILENALRLAVGATRAECDWVRFGEDGSFWPSGEGPGRIIRLFGISVTEPRFEKRKSSDEKGEFYIYVCTVRFSMPTGYDVFDAVGSCSSRKPFFGKKTIWKDDPKQPGKRIPETIIRPLHEITEDHVMKAAMTNCLANGVQLILGFKGVTEQELRRAGLDTSKIPVVRFARDRKRAQPKNGAPKRTSAAAPQSSRQAPAAGKGTEDKAEPKKGPPEAETTSMEFAEKKRRDTVMLRLAIFYDYFKDGLGLDPDERFGQYMRFRDGSPVTFEKAQTFKTARGVEWLERIVDKMQTDHPEAISPPEELPFDEKGGEG